MKAPNWTVEQDNLLRELAPTMIADEVAKILGRSVLAIRKRAVDKHIHFRDVGKTAKPTSLVGVANGR